MPSVYIKTYGCQMNERDSEAVAAQLVTKGYTLAASEHVADVVLLNTCSVRDNAEQKAINKMENIAGDIRNIRRALAIRRSPVVRRPKNLNSRTFLAGSASQTIIHCPFVQ